MATRIVLIGFKELADRYARFPRELDAAMKETMKAALIELHGSVPPYPVQNPDSTYRRTGTLGRSLGVGMTGRKEGAPHIYEVRREGGSWTAQFGTRLKYAPKVIGENEQAPVHRGRWWTIKTVAQAAAPKIERRFIQMAEKLGQWLDKPVN